MVTEAFEVTTKLWEYVTKITSTEKNIIMQKPILYCSLGQEPDGLKDEFSSLNFFD